MTAPPSDDPKEAALNQACDELGLPVYYRSCVKPLIRDPEGFWPRCCGSGCEPCAETLTQVALRTLELLGTPRKSPVP